MSNVFIDLTTEFADPLADDFRADVEQVRDAESTVLESPIVRDRHAQIACAHHDYHPLLVDLQNISQLIDQIRDPITRALFAKSAKV